MERCQTPPRRDDDVRWLALLARRVSILVVSEVERRFPDLEPALRTKQERERDRREQRAA